MGNVPGKNKEEKIQHKVRELTSKFSDNKLKKKRLEDKLKRVEQELEEKKMEVEKYKGIYSTDDNEDIQSLGIKLYDNISNRYKENIHLLGTQQTLLDRQNRLLGAKAILQDKITKQINDLDKNIVKNSRLLELTGEENNYNDSLVNFAKITMVVMVVFVVILLTTYKLKKK